MRDIVINVTQEDIDAGFRESCEKCPIALAAHRATKKSVAVGTKILRIEGDEYTLPVEAYNFIRAFDCDDTALPFTLTITDEMRIK